MRKKTEVIVVDFAEFKDMEDVHDFFSELFDFPEWYGRNHDALWDLLWDNDVMNRDVIIEVRNLGAMGEKMKRDAEAMRKIFLEMEKRSGTLKVVFMD